MNMNFVYTYEQFKETSLEELKNRPPTFEIRIGIIDFTSYYWKACKEVIQFHVDKKVVTSEPKKCYYIFSEDTSASNTYTTGWTPDCREILFLNSMEVK